jgi:aryl-alcohol dehydrogenase-like predicted oxidoreductase
MLKQRRLGQSDIMISPLGLGCWQFSRGQGLGGKYWAFLPDADVREIVRISLEGGINWFDTAEAYGKGESERTLARALRALGKSPGDVIIATKWRPLLRTAGSIAETVDTRLANLDGFPIDLHQIHNPYSFSSIKAQMGAMARLVRNKKIRAIGVSNFSAQQMRKAHKELEALGLRLVSNQVRYNLIQREIESNGVLDTAKELGISIIAYSPLAQGLLSGKFHDDPDLIKRRPGFRKYMRAFKRKALERTRPTIELVRELARKYDATPSQVALNWLVNFHGDTVVAIPGATSSAQARENVRSLTFALSPDDAHRIGGTFPKGTPFALTEESIDTRRKD